MYHVIRDDGRYLAYGTHCQWATPPPWETMAAATEAVQRYRLICAVYAPERKDDGFSIVKAS